MWTLITWKEFKDRKMEDSCDLADVQDANSAIEQMQTFNAQKLKTTSDYKSYNLSQLLEDRGLSIQENIQSAGNKE